MACATCGSRAHVTVRAAGRRIGGGERPTAPCGRANPRGSSAGVSCDARGVIPPAGYRTQAEVAQAMHALPGARVASLGRSVDGAPLLAAEIGPPGAPALGVILAGLHPLEWIGVEVALALAHRLATTPPAGRRFLVVPLANPDGRAQVEADLAAGRRRYRRTNARGVDLNRNWPVGFRAAVRHGPAPGSEPEVAAVLARLDAAHAAGARIDRAVSLHSIGNQLLLPWGQRWRRPARFHELHTHAAGIAGRLSSRYAITQVSHWLPGAFARGLEIDTLYARYGAAAILVECTLGGISPNPRSWLAPFRWYNPPGPAARAGELARALEPFMRGT